LFSLIVGLTGRYATIVEATSNKLNKTERKKLLDAMNLPLKEGDSELLLGRWYRRLRKERTKHGWHAVCSLPLSATPRVV